MEGRTKGVSGRGAAVLAGSLIALGLAAMPARALPPPQFAELANSFGAPADFDCDGRADISRRVNNGNWEIDLAANGLGRRDLLFRGYGGATAIPVPADYDGDCRADLSVKGGDGIWYIDRAANGFGAWDASYLGYGPTSVPVPADYDGDGKTDLSVKGATDGIWYIDYAVNGFGTWDAAHPGYGPTSVPVPADYDGDGRADLSVKGPTDGIWYIDYAVNGFGAWDAAHPGYGGTSVPAPADYDGDGKADLSVKGATDSIWYIDYAADGFGAWNSSYTNYYSFNSYKEELVPADYDGDGRADLSMHSLDEYWYIDYAANGFGVVRTGLIIWDLRDPLAAPVKPSVALQGHTAHALKVHVRARDSDPQGRSSAQKIQTSLMNVSNSTATVFGVLAWRDFTNLQSDTEYCVLATAINDEGSTSTTACFRTDYVPPPPPPPVGIRRVNVYNCTSEARPLHVWTRDLGTGSWVERGTASPLWSNGGCDTSASQPFAVDLQDGRSFQFVVVDPQLGGCNGQNNPEASLCQRSIYTQPLVGDSDGVVLNNVIG